MNGNFDLVIFGGTGDLALRKLYPALFRAECDACLHAGGRIIAAAAEDGRRGVSRPRERRLNRFAPDIIKAAPDGGPARFLARIAYFALDVNAPEQYRG